MTEADKADLDPCVFALDVVEKGQGELALDYIDIAAYMVTRGFSKSSINAAFSQYARQELRVV